MEEQQEQREEQGKAPTREPIRVRLPKFLIEEEIDLGLGEVIKRATYAIGIKPCAGCERRAASLNRRITFHR
jgi:hypothetical protein